MVLIAAKEFMAIPPAQRHLQTQHPADPGEINAHLAGIEKCAPLLLLEASGFLKVVIPLLAIQKTPLGKRILMPRAMKGESRACGQETADHEPYEKASHTHPFGWGDSA